MLNRRTVLSACLISALACTPALAQNPPEGPLHIVVPTTPGSTPDLLARLIGPKLSQRLGRPVVVENRTGASGNIGAEAVARAAPNGSTVLIAASTLATGAMLQPSSTFEATKDLAPVMLMGWSRLVLVTHTGTGFKSIDDLLQAARKAPGKLNYGSPGNGTPNHLAAELFKTATKTYIMHIPYRGSAQQLTDLVAGQIDMAPLTASAVAPHVRSGKLVPLAVTGDKRSPLLPGVPALSEQGIPGVDGNIWYGMFAPRGTPTEFVSRLNTLISDILRGEEAALSAQGFELETSTPQDLQQLLTRDTVRWGELIKLQGIKP
ncbi:tripartite tricarboxylate transporter substrate binding protein [Hydrogenophaga sp. BPS33]|uniref:tripartite tricarboxylate transporter substrate binding protein n=1 Tax=Hydrogenophaga sp. BPS33 TaxID=2651974 RepID=UPI00131FD22E|nr:tripartite tricarboxylate transporter substrate binding protein [Hydrogenophaga sp. BPS33]QHE88134.1 tripartite tricarboxylate transporter substrate binding protein [Hydrogenophaga sp. BPS33]